MARTPLVIQGPPKGQRTPVVVRQGPPPKKHGSWVDAATGIGGALLLLFAIALFGILPDEVVPPKSFMVTYQDELVEDPTLQDYYFADEQSHRYPVEIESSRVYAISFTVEWVDDFASSLPDQFSFEIIDSNGDPVGTEVTFSTPPPESDGNPVLPQFTAVPASQVVLATIANPPTNGPVTAIDPKESVANAEARLNDEAITRPAGTWFLDVTLNDAGDCPEPTGEDGPGRATACELETNQAGDPGNSLQVTKVTFTTYDAMVAN